MNRASWKEALYVLAGLAAVLLPLEWKYRYYFLQDDNRDFVLPWMVHAWRGLQQGELALYNFHQYSGYASLGSAQTQTLYPPGYLATFLSQALFGHVFAAVDILVILHLALGALGWLFFFRRLGLGPLAAAWGALACDLNSFVIYGGSSWMCVSVLAACFPWMLYFGLQFLRGPSWWSWAGLLVARLLLFYYGYVQYFVYGAALEMLVLAGVWLAAPGTVPKTARRSIVLSYFSSWIYVTLLAAPLLLPMWRQVEVSAARQAPLQLIEFVSLSLSLQAWNNGMVSPFSDLTPRGIGETLPFLGHVGYLTIIGVFAALWLARSDKVDDERRNLTLVFLGLTALTLLLAMGFLARELYQVPIYNRFRWPFKLLLFANYFQVVLAALAADRLVTRRSLGVVGLALTLANFLLLYTAYTPKPFRTHQERVPLQEPLRETLQGGKIFTLGFPAFYPRPPFAMAFDYATLWGLYHFAGYDPLVPAANSNLALQLEYFSTYQKDPLQVPWDHLRQWGVRWYVVSSMSAAYDTALTGHGLIPVHRDFDRRVYRDPQAKPLVFWEDGRSNAVDYDIRTNTIRLRTSSPETGMLCLSFLFHPRFSVLVDGHPGVIAANNLGQMRLQVPAGEHSLVVEYHDPDLRLGVWIAVVALAGLTLQLSLARRS